MSLNKQEISRFRQIGHKLKPIVSIGTKGLTESLLVELQRALEDHELIKVKVSAENREDKKKVIAALCEESSAELVQSIGHIVLVYRAAKTANPKLSNILRASV